jgi:hypothetical protein
MISDGICKAKEQNSKTILNPNNINENFKIIVVDFIANLKSAIYSKQGYFQYKLLPYLEYPRSL